MANTPIVSTLFRFVTTRNPQLLTKEERDRGFIYFPQQSRSNSHYLGPLDDEDFDDPEERMELLDNKNIISVASFKT